MYLKYMMQFGYESLHVFYDKKTNMKAIICIHDTKLGPALGGVRLYPYESEEEAIIDCLRLARGMTYKSAGAGLPLGGGKAVIICEPKHKNEDILRSFGKAVESLNGKYITAEDMNTTTEDMSIILEETSYVTGLNNKSGNPSPITALGAYYGILASLEAVFGNKTIEKRTFAVQGSGSTGKELIKLLSENNAKKIYYTDVNEKQIEFIKENYPNAIYVLPNDIYDLEVDCFIPCAFGGIVNDETIHRFKTKIIAGTANNVLLDEGKHSKALKDKNILYAPDFIINAGGVINIYHEIKGYNLDQVKKDIQKIYDRLLEIFKIAKTHDITTQSAAMTYAINNIEKGI